MEATRPKSLVRRSVHRPVSGAAEPLRAAFFSAAQSHVANPCVALIRKVAHPEPSAGAGGVVARARAISAIRRNVMGKKGLVFVLIEFDRRQVPVSVPEVGA